MQPSSVRKIIPIVPVGGDDTAESLYESQKKIYPRSVSGLFSRWRWGFVFLTQLVFYGLPWLEWGQRQAVLFDLGARRFYIFGLVLYPQDFIYLTGLLVVSALSLFLFTAVAGRLWCGFACPQTVYTEIFLWIERKVEGDRTARMRLDGAPMSAQKLAKKWLKHLLWISLAMWTGFTFVGFFSPIRELGMDFLQMDIGPWEAFWVFFYGFATYGNAGFMREQVCKYMCPYARFQSAMFDHDTLIVSYDTARGEPRGARSRKADAATLSLGACVDCTLCVQVCPTGIDIREGLQYECIGCAACVDVCDTVMDKMNYPRGLIRFSTQAAMANKWSGSQIVRRVLRPRVLVYGAVLLALCVGLLWSLVARTPLKVDVVRDRAALSRIVAGGKLENVYRLQIMNATEQPQRYRIAAAGIEGLVLASDAEVDVGPAESRWVAVRLQIPYGSTTPGSHPIEFSIGDAAGQSHLTEKSVFLVPR
ncbi:cytochrome c oxidase accessory protein CcoG [Polaromonas sp. A23]|uniref:cytochrome c oxidase accessory protein CcoG n=1 Tax=Polaromonas sp. A23 TaxID=1944133 RepID=UPI00098481FD|nr:cytochrome c oxidase accessory protein CcoG [Polaromonas sp. A23]OOG36715.1 cytochrome c oxidase accessory protein CcoG [Polaromonas sp. A23]